MMAANRVEKVGHNVLEWSVRREAEETLEVFRSLGISTFPLLTSPVQLSVLHSSLQTPGLGWLILALLLDYFGLLYYLLRA